MPFVAVFIQILNGGDSGANFYVNMRTIFQKKRRVIRNNVAVINDDRAIVTN
jgi:hypothetical protein